MLHSHLRLREDRSLLALGPCLPLPSPRWPPITVLHITAVGITSPAANISSNSLTASSIRPLLHHQRSPWHKQGRRHCVLASCAETLHHNSSGACLCSARRTPASPAHAHGSALLRPPNTCTHCQLPRVTARTTRSAPPSSCRSCSRTRLTPVHLRRAASAHT
jgi:hypothetical protein